jgi:hypothetical protein
VALHDIKGAVENLPDLAPRESTPAEPLAMTGTDPVVTPINERRGHHLATEGDGSRRDVSVPDVMTGSDVLMNMIGSSLENKTPVAPVRVQTGSDAKKCKIGVAPSGQTTKLFPTATPQECHAVENMGFSVVGRKGCWY